MKFLGFIIFSFVALTYIWNGKDNFNKKEWVVFFVKLSFILVGTFILVFVLIGLREIFPSMTKEDGELVLIVIPPSFVTLLLAKFFVIMLCTIFETIMRFHQRYNTEQNYSILSSLANRYGPGLILLAKCLASFGCILIFYGIWLASAA
ncbi:hypothetical protein ACLQUA_000768 [Enterobacter ludwigii]|uniref:hypothetical protein n=1 Tax=Enterobacter cloacae complex TaxID=354276 RepID=UPI001371CBE4|nr:MULTISPECIES: hypothetical protein [Enterobacter cloacae complex]MBQ0309153.1 hypothetical protein [Enterobacter ludwigii]MDP5159613.1 hypothetical protein [Enterobacter ludwigii]MDV8142169.1 hypothetical protein [Enterobacter ludwigii]MXV01884.1 hypothetical protein [Enterobacter sp. ABFQC]WNI98639.1 hypothetical protein RIK67_12560 [Enterobacter ludwigii]